jgi:predicted enzyme related to lactoylglutathione lyase
MNFRYDVLPFQNRSKPMNPFQQHGAFSWCELMTSDVEGAKRFYASLFGWEMQQMNLTEVDYTCVKVGEAGVGGIMELPAHMAGVPSHWGAVVTVDDVDATVQLAVELGATICKPPTDIPTVGRFSVLMDPQGAVISVITYCKPE